MKQIPYTRNLFGLFKTVLLALLGVLLGCKGYKEVDFQAERCKEAPSGNIKVTEKGHFRWEFELEGVSNTVETEPFRTVWIIEDASYAAQRVSYQFDKRGERKITVVMTNRCFMQTVKETTINVVN